MTDRPDDESTALRPPCVERLDPALVEIYRRMSPAERLRAGFDATEFIRDRIRAHLRGTRPDWTDEEVEAEVARRFRHASSR